ncbi:MAG: NAD(+)/NADH kinase [Actinomycetota bacterium]|nr:NAD(+)/NADH kinase [Actinomycetota bacterium]
MPEAVKRVAVVTHGKPEVIGEALSRLERVATEQGVEVILTEDELSKHGRAGEDADQASADLVVVLGGDGTMLRAFQRFLGTGIPVIGVNYGRVGFLASIEEDELETGLSRVFGGDYAVYELATLEVEVEGDRRPAVNDVVVTSATLGRMVELGWAVGGEDLGVVPCDGLVCCTPTGSTAYNLSNGGPVLVWGLDAMAITFAAPHLLHARPLVVPRSRELAVSNQTADVGVTVLVDGRPLRELAHGQVVTVRLSEQHSRLATLPERTFFRRYRETFGS